MVPQHLVYEPLRLASNAFTALSRTPWAGTYLSESIKDELCPELKGQPIGESWELSADPAFPSQLKDYPYSLGSLLQAYPAASLSTAQVERCEGQLQVTVKLISAAAPLSFQVHPSDNDPGLKAGECGKPESWLILDRTPGAGVYLGFAQAQSAADLKSRCYDQRFGVEDLFFVPVEPGDYFDIPPGVPHAIGAGVTLLEPQRVLAGQSGKTYRLWDWNRRYNAAGQLDPDGALRPLDLDAALALVDPLKQVGNRFANKIRRAPEYESVAQGGKFSRYPANAHYQLSTCKQPAAKSVWLTIYDGYGAVTAIHGELEISSASGKTVTLPRGLSCFLPAQGGPWRLSAKSAAYWSLVVPGGAEFNLSR